MMQWHRQNNKKQQSILHADTGGDLYHSNDEITDSNL